MYFVVHVTNTGGSLSNVPHVYYMCDTPVMHVWCFGCITHVIHTHVMHV